MDSNSARRKVALPILFAFTMLPLLLLFVTSTWEHADQQPSSSIAPGILYALEILILLVAAGYTTMSLRPELPPQRFVQSMILCLVLSEFAWILAFAFLSSLGGASMAPAVAGSVLVNVFFIGPRVLAFLRT